MLQGIGNAALEQRNELIPSGIPSTVGDMSAFNASRAFTPVAGLPIECDGTSCRATNTAHAGVFAALQRQLNAIDTPNAETTAVTGVIDAATLARAKIVRRLLNIAIADPGNVQELATVAQNWIPILSGVSGVEPDFRAPAIPQATPGVLPEPLSPGVVSPDGQSFPRWTWYIGGAILVAVLGYIGLRVTRRKSTFKGGPAFDDFDYREPDGEFIDV